MSSDDRLQRIGISTLCVVYVISFAAYVGIWVTAGRCDTCFANLFSNNFLTFLALAGGALGLVRSHGAFKGPWRCPGIVPTMLSIGLLTWSLGSMAWTYYNFSEQRSIPYPSWAEAGYFSQIVLTLVGILVCFKMTNKPMLDELLKPKGYITLAAGGVYFVMRAVRAKQEFESDGDLVKFVFDILYPIGSTVNAILLLTFLFGVALHSFTWARKKMARSMTFLLAGSLLLGLADFFFNLGTSVPKTSLFAYTNGNWTDAIYLSGLFALSLGVLLFPLAALTTGNGEGTTITLKSGVPASVD
jgi:hypothetical protein